MQGFRRGTQRYIWQRRVIQFLVFLGGLLIGTSPALAINKCTGPGGQTVFQDAPCPGQGETVREDIERKQRERAAERAKPKSYEESYREARDAREAYARQTCGASFTDYPTVGMTEQSFRQCTYLGLMIAADAVNETETAAGVSRQYVYRDGTYNVRYVYTRNNRVTAIQR